MRFVSTGLWEKIGLSQQSADTDLRGFLYVIHVCYSLFPPSTPFDFFGGLGVPSHQSGMMADTLGEMWQVKISI